MKTRKEKAFALIALFAVSLFSMSFVLHQNATAVLENDHEKWLAVGASTGLAGWWAGRKMLAGGKKERDKRLGCCGLIAVIAAAVIGLVILKKNDVF